MNEDQKKMVTSLVRGFAPVIAEHVKTALEPLTKRLDALEAKPTLRYCGVWDKGTSYGEGAVTTHEGSAWVAKGVTQAGERPGDSAVWQLCVKRGRDAR